MPNRSAYRALLLTNNTTRWSVGGADYTQMKRKRHPFTGASSLGWRPNIPAGRSRSDPSRNIESRGSTGFRPNIGLISARFTNLTGQLVNASRQPLTFPPSPAWSTARALKTRHNAGRPRLNHLLINGLATKSRDVTHREFRAGNPGCCDSRDAVIEWPGHCFRESHRVQVVVSGRCRSFAAQQWVKTIWLDVARQFCPFLGTVCTHWYGDVRGEECHRRTHQ